MLFWIAEQIYHSFLRSILIPWFPARRLPPPIARSKIHLDWSHSMERRAAIALLTVAMSGSLAVQILAQNNNGNSVRHAKILSFDVGDDETLTYPSNLTNIPDEHTTIMPIGAHNPVYRPGDQDRDSDAYLIFASSGVTGGNGGVAVLESAAKLAINPAGEEPADRTYPVAVVVISDGRKSDRP